MDVVKQRLIAGEGTPEATWQAWFADHPLPVHQLSTLLGNASNIIVVAPHPDDEIVGCAGLLRQAARLGVKICIVAVTDGEASHTGSRNWTTQSLSRTRTEESLEAVRRLSIHARRDRLAIADGTVSQHESELSERLMPFIMPGDAVIAPWCFDGHPITRRCHERVGALRQLVVAGSSRCPSGVGTGSPRRKTGSRGIEPLRSS